MELGSLPDSRGSMKQQLLLMVLGVAALGCGSDPTSVANANPDSSSCVKGSIAAGDTKTGALTSASCLRYDHAYTEDTMPFDSYEFKAEKGKGYEFSLGATDNTTEWDAILELVTVNPSTGEEQLLAISDDEGAGNYAQMYFIAPVSGTFFVRAAGYDRGELASYTLAAKSCDSPIPQITGALAVTTVELSSSDCVLSKPNFTDDSSHVRLFSVLLAPNETKTITVQSDDFGAAFQVYGPAWGVACYYAYEGCGGDVSDQTKGNPQPITIHGAGDLECNDALHAPDHIGPLASRVSGSVNICEQFDWPGQYTIAVGSDFNSTGSFTIAVQEGDLPSLRRMGPDAPIRNPTLDFLRKKPLRANEYLNRSH